MPPGLSATGRSWDRDVGDRRAVANFAGMNRSIPEPSELSRAVAHLPELLASLTHKWEKFFAQSRQLLWRAG